MIKTIFFDFDGVVTTDEFGGATMTNNYVVKTGIDAEKIQACMKPFVKPLKRGEIKHADMWNEFCACLGENLDKEVLDYVFKTIPKNEAILDLVLECKKKGFKTGLITANFAERMNVLRIAHNLDRYFDVYAISGQVGALKDDAKLFEFALKEAGSGPEECIMIDNHEHKLAIPKEMGFHTYWFDHEKNDIQSLRSWIEEKIS